MTNPFIQTTDSQLQEMVARAGAASIDGIFRDQIPADLEYRGALDLPPALSELELVREIAAISASNSTSHSHISFMGGGVCEHFIPSAVGHLAGRSEFVTAYTPYQPEASQGTLQAFFEFQSLVARLFSMDVANASLYDGASALGEALFMALACRTGRNRILLPATLHPDSRAVADTYLRHTDVRIDTVPCIGGTIDLKALAEMAAKDTAAVVVQQPNYLGCLEETDEIARIAHASGGLLVAACDPISVGLIRPPGAYGADIAVAEGQPLGLRQYMGGESLGLFTCRKEHMRKMPGRLVGIAQDDKGRRGFVLTLQTREQHIRREKATSNICTNHAHNALRATVYLSLMGPRGLARTARACARNLHRLRSRVAAIKPDALAHKAPVFKECVIRLKTPPREAWNRLHEQGFLAGVPLDEFDPGLADCLLVCVTECRTDAQIDSFADALGRFL